MADELDKDLCVDDLFANDWLSGEYTGKQKRLRKELERANCWGL